MFTFTLVWDYDSEWLETTKNPELRNGFLEFENSVLYVGGIR